MKQKETKTEESFSSSGKNNYGSTDIIISDYGYILDRNNSIKSSRIRNKYQPSLTDAYHANKSNMENCSKTPGENLSDDLKGLTKVFPSKHIVSNHNLAGFYKTSDLSFCSSKNINESHSTDDKNVFLDMKKEPITSTVHAIPRHAGGKSQSNNIHSQTIYSVPVDEKLNQNYSQKSVPAPWIITPPVSLAPHLLVPFNSEVPPPLPPFNNEVPSNKLKKSQSNCQSNTLMI